MSTLHGKVNQSEISQSSLELAHQGPVGGVLGAWSDDDCRRQVQEGRGQDVINQSHDTCVGKKKNGARRRSVLTAGQIVQEGWGQDVIDHPSSQEERQVILCAGHIQLEIIHTVQQALEALLHLISLNDLVVQAGQQVCCHLMLPEEEEEENKEEEEALAGS